MREQPLEVAVDHIEGGKQALAALAVEALDRLAQLADRLDHVLAFRNDRLQPLGKLPLLLLGAQIDRAEPLALDLQPVEPLFDLGHVGQRRVGVQLRLADRQMRRRVQHLLDARFRFRRRSSAAFSRSSARARPSRASDSAVIAAVAALSSAACLVSASCRRSAAALRSVSASESWDSSARRLASISSGVSASDFEFGQQSPRGARRAKRSAFRRWRRAAPRCRGRWRWRQGGASALPPRASGPRGARAHRRARRDRG